MKILLIVKDAETSWFLINKLSKKFSNLMIAIEKTPSKYSFLKKQFKKNSFTKVLGQILFKLLSIILIFFYKKNINLLKEKYQLLSKKSYKIVNKYLYSINSDECIKWLKEEKPDIIIINGTQLVSKNTIDSINAIFLNIHCGITPKYRGVHGGYWASISKDIDNIGVTVHLVDYGIDTGGIAYQEKINIDKTDNIFTYPIKQYSVGIKLMIKTIEDIYLNKLKLIEKKSIKSQLWKHPTIVEYIKNWYLLGIK